MCVPLQLLKPLTRLQQAALCFFQILCGLPAEQQIPAALGFLQRLEPSDTGVVVRLLQYLGQQGGKTAVFGFTQLTSCFDLRIKVGLQDFLQRDFPKTKFLKGRLKLRRLKPQRRGEGTAKNTPGGVALLLGCVVQPNGPCRPAIAAVFFQQLGQDTPVSGPGPKIGRADPGLRQPVARLPLPL